MKKNYTFHKRKVWVVFLLYFNDDEALSEDWYILCVSDQTIIMRKQKIFMKERET